MSFSSDSKVGNHRFRRIVHRLRHLAEHAEHLVHLLKFSLNLLHDDLSVFVGEFFKFGVKGLWVTLHLVHEFIWGHAKEFVALSARLRLRGVIATIRWRGSRGFFAARSA